ncbi:MAG: Zn-dependent hydrolase [Haloarculaceae archaeon]
MEVDRERLRGDLEANGHIGEVEVEEGWGRTVPTGTDADRDARDRFVERLEEAGLEVRVDPVGNIAGRWIPETADPDAAPVAAGSHLDSVPHGGIFDGPLGAYGALEAVRSIRDSPVEPVRPLEVVSWTEEEGVRFGTGLLGSSVAAGMRSEEEALALTDGDRRTLDEELERIGYRGEATIDPASWDAWFEIHVEQGTVLESAGIPVGVVTAIAGIANCAVTFEGEANHAGATPMDERRDALAAASEFVLDVERAARDRVREGHEAAVGTVGNLTVSPNANNVVPGRIELTTDQRDVDPEVLRGLVDSAETSARRVGDERPVSVDFDHYRLTEPSRMNDRCVDAAVAAADRAGLGHERMHSAGLHDTANVANVTDTALLFAPSADGDSHNPREWTDWVDCAAAARVLAGAMADLAT